MKTDITKNKHGGNAQSNAAFEKIEGKITRTHLEILHHMSLYKVSGTTSKDIAELFDCHLSAISGRITELKRMGKIKQIGRRDGCAVYVVRES
jgi:predicted HTH transcriptional regulator